MGSAKTRFSITKDNPFAEKADVIIVPVFKKPEPKNENGKTGKNKAKDADPATAIDWPVKVDNALRAEILELAADEKFDGSRGKLLTVRASSGNKLKARRLIVLGLGEKDGRKGLQPKHWEANLIRAVGAALGLKDAKALAIQLPPVTDALSTDVALSLAVDAVYQATYKSTEAKEPPATDVQVRIISNNGSARENETLRQADILAQARSFVKDLVNRPANLKSTDTLVDAAKAIGKKGPVKVTVQSNAGWIEKNMPCFYTVARGSVATDPPKFITLQYTPKSGRAKKHVAVVGKSVIFDTGGYQVKPGDYMVTMKGDMTGGAVALATMQALAELQPRNIAVTAYLAATPNKIDSDAMVPDSIVNTTVGKKVEIRHTDAEGRLTLIDAVAQAVKEKPDEIITIATLTGSASQAVGYTIAMMGNDPGLRDRVEQAGKSLAEPIQTLDVTEDDYDAIKSKLDGADIINTSQRKHRGAQSAAAFVMSGAPEEMPMVHMDIAGADMTGDEKATGISVKTVLQYLLNEDAQFRNGKGGNGSRPAEKSVSAATKTGGGKTTTKAKAGTSKAKTTAKPAKAKSTVKTTAKAKPAKRKK